MAAGEEQPRAGTEDLVERFLAGSSDRTRQAYTTDLEDFAHFRGRGRTAAIAELLASREQGCRLALAFAVDLRRRGLAPATVRRRLNTLSSLVGTAGELGAVEWSLEIPTEDQVAAANQPGQDRAGRDLPYYLPRHEAEIDRLDIQHYALRAHLGANFLALVSEPARILDVGCGTGQWAYELCGQFPDALVVGLDLAPSKRPWPATYRFVRANLLQGLPFPDGRFDFVHQRLLLSGVPVRAWAQTMTELVRVTQPGGWVELVEGAFEIGPAGPATGQLFEMVWRLSRVAGLDTTGIIFRSLDEHLRRAGLTGVSLRQLTLPFGEWGGRIGSLMATDCRTLFIRLAPTFEAKFGVSERECRELVTAAQQEWEQHHTVIEFAIVTGRKPG